jgi:transposase-like protein
MRFSPEVSERAIQLAHEHQDVSISERQNRELKRANEILLKASAYFAKGRSSADRNDDDIR